MRAARLAVLVLPLLLAAGCKPERPAAQDPSRAFTCPGGLVVARKLMASFAVQSANRARIVTEEEWRRFRDQEIAPRFPKGATLSTVQDTWQDHDGATMPQESRVLTVILPLAEERAGLTRLQAAINAYHRLFPDQTISIGYVPTCVAGFTGSGEPLPGVSR